MIQIARLLGVLGVLMILATGCQSTNRAMGENRSDATITAAVKERIVKDRTANLTDVNVDTRDGTVYLRGQVPTIEDKVRAARLARDVQGVDRVINDLRVTAAMAPSSTDTTRDSTLMR